MMGIRMMITGCLLAGLAGCADVPNEKADLVELSNQTAEKAVAPFMNKGDLWGPYYMELTWEAMLCFGSPEFERYVLEKMQERDWTAETVIPYERQPFGHVNYRVGKTTGEPGWLENFAKETMRYRREAVFTPEGAITLNDKRLSNHPMLLDVMQDYASRLAQTAAITGDETLYEESAAQFRIYREVLRDPQTGLYSQGRGFLPDPKELSPGAWSRGHGWLIRGMVDSLEAMPRGSVPYCELQQYLRELADALLAVQGDTGMWHQLLHLPLDDSYPETSGSALIAANLAKAWNLGLLDNPKYRDAALRAFRAIAQQVGDDGAIAGTCKAPGPLRSIDGYFRTPGEPNDPHGLFAVLFACAEISRIR